MTHFGNLMRALLLISFVVTLGCAPEQLRTDNVGRLTPEDGGCPPTWLEASARCRPTANPAPCPTVDRCTYAEMGDCTRHDRLCADAVAECVTTDAGPSWTCAQ